MKDFSVIIAHLDDSSELYFTIYNYLKELESFDFEIIIVDNGSEGFDYGRVEYYVDTIGRTHDIKFVSYTEFQGTVPPWQHGAKMAEGKYLIFSDSHILNSVDYFKKQMEVLKSDDLIKTLYGGCCFQQWGEPLVCGYHFLEDSFSVVNETTNNVEPYELLVSQMGCVITEREHFIERGMFGVKCFDEWGGRGAEEFFLAVKTWMFGGKCVLNPNVFHLHSDCYKKDVGKKTIGHNMCIGAYVLGGEEYLQKVLAGNSRVVVEVANKEEGLEFVKDIPRMADHDREFLLANATYSFKEIMKRGWYG